jgi:hypothetical protein
MEAGAEALESVKALANLVAGRTTTALASTSPRSVVLIFFMPGGHEVDALRENDLPGRCHIVVEL